MGWGEKETELILQHPTPRSGRLERDGHDRRLDREIIKGILPTGHHKWVAGGSGSL